MKVQPYTSVSVKTVRALFFIRQPIMISLPGNLLSTLGQILNFPPVNKSRVIHFFRCEIIFTTKEIIFMVFHKWIFRFFRYNQSYNLRRSINGAIIVLARDPWTLTGPRTKWSVHRSLVLNTKCLNSMKHLVAQI